MVHLVCVAVGHRASSSRSQSCSCHNPLRQTNSLHHNSFTPIVGSTPNHNHEKSYLSIPPNLLPGLLFPPGLPIPAIPANGLDAYPPAGPGLLGPACPGVPIVYPILLPMPDRPGDAPYPYPWPWLERAVPVPAPAGATGPKLTLSASFASASSSSSMYSFCT